MTTKKITETLETAQSWLTGVNATVDLLAESLTDEDGQAAANPATVAAVLYGVLNQVRAAQEEIAVASALAHHGEG